MSVALERLALAMEAIPQLLREEARTLVVDLQRAGVDQAHANLMESGAIDTRATYDGIEATEPRELERGWSGEVRAAARQSIFIERGRQPGRKMPPGGVLLGWMERHGIGAEAEFLIRRAIGRRGIPARPFMGPLGRQLAGDQVRLLGQVEERLRARLIAFVRGS